MHRPSEDGMRRCDQRAWRGSCSINDDGALKVSIYYCFSAHIPNPLRKDLRIRQIKAKKNKLFGEWDLALWQKRAF